MCPPLHKVPVLIVMIFLSDEYFSACFGLNKCQKDRRNTCLFKVYTIAVDVPRVAYRFRFDVTFPQFSCVSLAELLVHVHVLLFIHSFIHSLTHSFIHSFLYKMRGLLVQTEL